MSDPADPALLKGSESPDGGDPLPVALRSRARHLAMLALYSQEANRFEPARPLRETLAWLCLDPPRRARARAIVEAALAERRRLDGLLDAGATDEWKLSRMGAAERALLRVSAAEMVVLRDAPAGAVINDAVEIAKRYGDEAAPGFVNAVLSNFTRVPEVAAALAARPSGECRVDLHVHTTASDGTMTPEEVVAAAVEAGLAAVAVADHDEVTGIAPAAAAGERLGLEVVPAVELTCYLGDDEAHILGYFVDHLDAVLNERLAALREVRRQRAAEICRRLAALGVPVEVERVMAIAKGGAVGRPHLASALVEAGHVSSVKEAFARFLYNGGPAWVPKTKLTPGEAVELVHAAGGLAFLAHPGAMRRDNVLPDLVRAGLDGLEVRHCLHAHPTAEHYLHWAHRQDLLTAGGSDFHGSLKEGAPLGQPFVPESWLIEMRNCWALRRGTG